MSVSPFDSRIYGPLLSDDETAALFEDAAELRSLLAVEAALARVQGRLGIIPAEAAARITAVADQAPIEPAALAEGAASAGVVVPALVTALREAVGGEAAAYVHWGATSQDIVDCALLLRLRDLLALQEARLARLIERLCAEAEAHRGTVMAARTRSQQATPTSFGLKLAGWAAPLLRHRQRLAELRPRLLAVQFGGAAGTLSALEGRGLAVAEALAAELDLAEPLLPWHNQRDSLAELAAWLSLVTGSLGKIGQDLVLLGQSELAEVRAGAGGGSSTMPQKANPVGAEALVALARSNAGLLGSMHQALVHEQERDGAAWSLEWLTLPQMAVAASAALRHALALIGGLEVDAARMRRNLEDSRGLVLAEAASFALAAHMPWPEAQALVKAACVELRRDGGHLIDILAERCPAAIDWDRLRDPANALGAAEALIDRVLEQARGATCDR